MKEDELRINFMAGGVRRRKLKKLLKKNKVRGGLTAFFNDYIDRYFDEQRVYEKGNRGRNPGKGRVGEPNQPGT